MIRLTVFLAGAALMALEMLGSRILAPTFGNSIFVWGSLIGVVLAALSAGYYVGGVLADRYPAVEPLALGIGGAGLWVWVTPAISAAVNPWIAGQGFGPRAGPLLACLLLFAGPSVLIALVSPWAIRLAARSVSSVGSTAGSLYALSTAGSIAGTLVTAFYLIPAVGVADLTRMNGLTLVGLAAANMLAVRRVRAALAAGAVAAALAVMGPLLPAPAPLALNSPLPVPASPAPVAPPAAAPSPEPAAVGPIAGPKENGVVYRTDSLYHHILVHNVDGIRLLRFDESYQSGMDLSDPLKTVFAYTDVLSLPFALRPDARRALLVGLGGGSIVKQLLANLPHLALDVAELDPDVIRVAQTYFGVPEHPRLRIAAQDGREFVAQASARYDVVLLDAYYANAIPFHLTTREFLELTKSRMAPNGVVAANIIGAVTGARSALLRSMAATMGDVFPQVYVIPVGDRQPHLLQNVIIMATVQEQRLTSDELIQAALNVSAALKIPGLPEYAARVLTSPLRSDDVPILTDDFAPVDNLMHLD